MLRQVGTGIKVRSSGNASSFAIEWCPPHQTRWMAITSPQQNAMGKGGDLDRGGRPQVTEQKIQEDTGPVAHWPTGRQAPSGTTTDSRLPEPAEPAEPRGRRG